MAVKFFVTLAPGGNVIKLFVFVSKNKLDSFSIKNIFWQVQNLKVRPANALTLIEGCGKNWTSLTFCKGQTLQLILLHCQRQRKKFNIKTRYHCSKAFFN